MSMLFKNVLVDGMMSTNPEEEVEKEELRYLLLLFTEDENGNKIKVFDYTVGRMNAVDRIFEFYEEYGVVDWFKSTVISEKVTPGNGISFYSFLRYVFELKQDDFIIPNITSIDELHDFLSNDPSCEEQYDKYNLRTEDDINQFYEKDLAHKI